MSKEIIICRGIQPGKKGLVILFLSMILYFLESFIIISKVIQPASNLSQI